MGLRLVRELSRMGGWQVIAVSRRATVVGAGSLPGAHALALDLLDHSACIATLSRLHGITHVMSAARHDFETGKPESDANTAMLSNVLDALRETRHPLEHVHLVHGSKYYGSNLGPFLTPASEVAPRSRQHTFYYDQEDMVIARSAAEGWHWSTSRPHAVVDPERVLARSIPTIIAVYATIARELGEPLCFPGTPENYRAEYQFTDAGLLARAIAWMSTDVRARDMAFNVNNGDSIRWCDLWPRIADYFGMACGPVRTVRLAEEMPGRRAVWHRLVERYGLRSPAYEVLATWKYGDFVFRPAWDHLFSTTRCRQLGFQERVATEPMIFDMFDGLRSAKVIPQK